MTHEELLLRAMTYDHPPQLPVGVWFLPAAWKKRPLELRALVTQYRDLFPNAEQLLARDFSYTQILPDSYRAGSFTDEWGCVWENVEEGMEAIVTGHPVARREDIAALPIPDCRDGRLPHGFMYLRLLDLRGFEEVMIDFAEECDELQLLIDKVVTYNGYQVEALLARHTGPIFHFADDLGMQNGLAIGAARWRKYMKPAFAKVFAPVKAAGKRIYMHTDGCIHEIMPDLAEIGVDMINPQFRANGLDNLVRVCKGKIPIFLDLDRQMFSVATPSQLHDHVRRCVEALYLPEGGLGLNVEIGMDVPPENVEALLAAVSTYRHYKG